MHGSVRSGACHWMTLGNACGVGWPDESLLDLDCPARPSAQKGVVVWGFLALSAFPDQQELHELGGLKAFAYRIRTRRA